MASSPVVIPFTTDGVQIAATDGLAIPANARGFVGVGYDGANLRFFRSDTSGRQVMVGAAASGAAVAGNPVLIAGSDGTNVRTISTATDGTVRVDPTGTTTQPVSGTVTAAQGTAAALAGYWPVRVTDGTNTMPTLDTVGRRGFVTITDGTNSLPTGDAIARAIFVRQTDGTNNATIKAASVTAVAADTGIVVAPRASATGTQTSVASSATSVQLLAANTARMGTIIFNDSTQVCFVKFGTTASNTSFAYRLTSNSTLEVPYGYTGRIDAIWASANGNARITEMT